MIWNDPHERKMTTKTTSSKSKHTNTTSIIKSWILKDLWVEPWVINPHSKIFFLEETSSKSMTTKKTINITTHNNIKIIKEKKIEFIGI